MKIKNTHTGKKIIKKYRVNKLPLKKTSQKIIKKGIIRKNKLNDNRFSLQTKNSIKMKIRDKEELT